MGAGREGCTGSCEGRVGAMREGWEPGGKGGSREGMASRPV